MKVELKDWLNKNPYLGNWSWSLSTLTVDHLWCLKGHKGTESDLKLFPPRLNRFAVHCRAWAQSTRRLTANNVFALSHRQRCPWCFFPNLCVFDRIYQAPFTPQLSNLTRLPTKSKRYKSQHCDFFLKKEKRSNKYYSYSRGICLMMTNLF